MGSTCARAVKIHFDGVGHLANALVHSDEDGGADAGGADDAAAVLKRYRLVEMWAAHTRGH